jgi:hypothetical protein
VIASFANRVQLVGNPDSGRTEWRLIGIGAMVAHRPLPHHRAYGSVHGGSRS